MDITDNLFQQFVTCPLKLYHHQDENREPRTYLPFKHRNKLQLRDAVAVQFQNRKFTSDDTQTALKETEAWLLEDEVTICGAVIKSGPFLSRIPILKKKGEQFTIIQIHGKLRKRSQSDKIRGEEKSRTTTSYILKAAYRTEVLRRLYPGAEFLAQFYFPQRDFKATTDSVLQKAKTARDADPDPEFIENCSRLFAMVDATEGVQKLISSVPENIAHKTIAGESIADTLKLMESRDWSEGNILNIKIHRGCRSCDYRRRSPSGTEGCWSRFFVESELNNPERHVFELIGHGNEIDTNNGHYYQENVPYADQFASFEMVQKYGGPKITIQQRRVLQLLKAKGESVPSLWAKPILKQLDHLEYPLHFIDFEAATYALPMNRGDGPYKPVYFQYSCHTLYENGEIKEANWLDEDSSSGHPHHRFIHSLTGVKDIYRGTIVQYSPFEVQGVRQLLAEMKRNSMKNENEIDRLKRLLGGNSSKDNRFYDISSLIRDAYFSSKLEGSLGLKQVLKSILKWQKENSHNTDKTVRIFDKEINLFPEDDTKSNNPYKQIQDDVTAIDDGENAMHAYISMKSDLLTKEESAELPEQLKRYCALDSYSMILIYKHLKMLTEQMSGEEDLIIM